MIHQRFCLYRFIESLKFLYFPCKFKWLQLLFILFTVACTRNSIQMTTQQDWQVPPKSNFSEQLLKQLNAAYVNFRSKNPKSPNQPTKTYLNRLALQSSPYLLQHAQNPVNWYPWGNEAFEAAKTLNKPIFLSIGYSTCHWCHVMEHESFEDLEIASYLNEHFISIKVDREERPDIDAVYMTAVQLLSGGGGWPMTVILTPEKQPFFAGTYFPARDGERRGMIGFLTLLKRINEAWSTMQDRVVKDASRITLAIQRVSETNTQHNIPTNNAIVDAVRYLEKNFDQQYGGFGSPPKFPRPSTYELILRFAHRAPSITTSTASGLPSASWAKHMVQHSLHKMANGGIYDHIGGGFARYSTDRTWLVPHFEKMLYDNAQLVMLLRETWQVTSNEEFAWFAKDTLNYILKEMTNPLGGFYSATDADSEGEEGKFFVWTREEIQQILDKSESDIFIEAFGVSEEGNFEGKNILHRAIDKVDLVQKYKITTDELAKILSDGRAKLYTQRQKRIHPLLDDKIITSWNGQMISAMARSGFTWQETQYVDAAIRAQNFLLDTLINNKSIKRTWRAGVSQHDGTLDDYVWTIHALLDLFQVTSELKWLKIAIEYEEILHEQFWDPKDKAYFQTGSNAEKLVARLKPSYDGAEPSGNSIAAINALKLYQLTGNSTYKSKAEDIISVFADELNKGAVSNPKLAQALDYLLDDPKEIVVVLPEDVSALNSQLIAILRKNFLPNGVFVFGTETELEKMAKLVPWVSGKKSSNNQETAYVCYEGRCKSPTQNPEEFEKQISEIKITDNLTP